MSYVDQSKSNALQQTYTIYLLFQLEQSGKLHKKIADQVSNFHPLSVSLCHCLQYIAPGADSVKFYKGHRLSVTSLVVTTNSQYVYTGGKDCTIIKCNYMVYQVTSVKYSLLKRSNSQFQGILVLGTRKLFLLVTGEALLKQWVIQGMYQHQLLALMINTWYINTLCILYIVCIILCIGQWRI